MDFDLAQTIDLLERTPATLRALLAGLDDGWINGSAAAHTFSSFDVIGHLISGEKHDWMARVRLIVEHGTERPFPPFDRYAHFEASRGKTIGELLDEFTRVRAENLAALRALDLTTADLMRRGRHPAFGEVTLEQLLATWLVHDLNHLAQIAKALASQYEDAVGPWRQYLGILKTTATPMDAEGIARRAQSRGD